MDITSSTSDAGGVGALLQIADHASGKTFLPCYDGNGNVVALLNASTGAVAAAYEYSPFGEFLRCTADDPVVADQPFRFSTKYYDGETGLYYFGRRYLSPSQGRFLGRDPKFEIADKYARKPEGPDALHLHLFTGNNPINRWDYLGMYQMGVTVDGLPNPFPDDNGYSGVNTPWDINPVIYQPNPSWTVPPSVAGQRAGGSGSSVSRPQALTREEQDLLKNWRSLIKFVPAEEKNEAFEQQVLADIDKLLNTRTATGVEIMIARSLINPNLDLLTVNYGTGSEFKGSGGSGRNLYLNSTSGQLYTTADHLALRRSQGEIPSGPNASAIILAHEIGHGLVSDGFANLSEYGAVTYFENPYRDAFRVGQRTTYDGVRLAEREERQSDINTWNYWSQIYRNPTPWR